jgi:alkanesulfonate monooxygenase
MSGSSPAGLAAAKKIGAIAIQYLKPSFSYNGVTLPSGSEYGARVGIIARETAELAWASAEKRYPESSDGTSIRNYYIKVSDSFWVKELGQTINVPEGHPYWLGPYKNNQAACPFLVGSRRNVASELAAYIAMGIRTFLIEKPENTEDADEISETFKMAQHLATITPTTPHVEISSANLSARPG